MSARGAEGYALRVGVLLPTRCSPDSAGVSELAVEAASEAEKLGLDAVWVGESILARPRLDPLALLAAVATRTSRLQLGTAVLLPALHPPLLLANTLATLDQIAGGRLVVGVGIGIDNPDTRREFAACGVPFEQRVGRTVAAVRLLRTLFGSGEGPDRPGAPGRITRYWDLSDVSLDTRPARPGGPPFWIGSTVAVDRALERAGRHFDGFMPTWPDPDEFRTGYENVRAAARRAGRRVPPTPVAYLTLSIDADRDRARERLSRFMESYYGIPFEVMVKVQGCFAGSAAECARWLARYAAAGIEHVIVRLPGEGFRQQLRALAREVVPLVRAARDAS